MNLIGYLRVSTHKQGASGLGLEAQQAAIREYAQRSGAVLVKEYVEVETGKRSDRPELVKSLAHARRSKSALCVAKLDRLSRNVAFLSAIMDSGVEFVCCDQPQANRFTLHILAAVAEEEARMISVRTKAALKAYAARGGKLGNPANLTVEAAAKGRKLAVKTIKRNAREAYLDILPILADKRKAGLSYRAIAIHLNSEGYVTRTGKTWRAQQVVNAFAFLPGSAAST